MGDVIRDRKKFEHGWQGGLPETPCGWGSTLAATAAQRAWLPEIVREHHVKTVADIGAGDLNWMRRLRWPPDVVYTAYDLVPRSPAVLPLDIVREPAPRADLLLCLWVLNHLPYADALAAWANLRASGSPLLVMTDRPRWHAEQPPELRSAPVLAQLPVRPDTGDRLLLVRLC